MRTERLTQSKAAPARDSLMEDVGGSEVRTLGQSPNLTDEFRHGIVVGRAWKHSGDASLWFGFEQDHFERMRATGKTAPVNPVVFIRKASRSLLPQPAVQLSPTPSIQDLRLVRTAPGLESNLKEFQRLATGPLADYSAEEIRQLMGRPELTRDYVATHIAPRLGELDRTVDRLGDEPHFLIAVQLAHFMLSCKPGTTEYQALTAFVREKELIQIWPNLVPADLARLRRLYPFIPTWPNGVKSPTCMSLRTEIPSNDAATRVWRDIVRDIETLAKIPLTDIHLERVAIERAEQDRMKGAVLVEATGTFANIVPRLAVMTGVDGMRGRDIHLVAKHYSSAPVIADAIRRVFGAEVIVEKDDPLAVLRATCERVTRELGERQKETPGAEPARILLHVEGVKGFWPWLNEHAQAHPNIAAISVSHTSSDGRDFRKTIGDHCAFQMELMAFSPAKIRDERLRFEQSFTALVDALGKALPGMAVYNRPWVIMGYGSIIGPAMAAALKTLKVPYAVCERDPDRRREAAEIDGHPTVDNLTGYYDQNPCIVDCAGAEVLGGKEMQKFTGNPLLMSLGSGRYGFDMEYLEAKSNERADTVNGREVGRLGWLPIVSYAIEGERGPATFMTVADGYVANLAFPEPHQSTYSMSTQLLAWEALRQGIYHYEQKHASVHVLRALDIVPTSTPSGGVTRRLCLYSRDFEGDPGSSVTDHYQDAGGSIVPMLSAPFEIHHFVPAKFLAAQKRPYQHLQPAYWSGWDTFEGLGDQAQVTAKSLTERFGVPRLPPSVALTQRAVLPAPPAGRRRGARSDAG
jgi:hypothetical protein